MDTRNTTLGEFKQDDPERETDTADGTGDTADESDADTVDGTGVDSDGATGETVVAATLDVPMECAFTNASGMNDLPSYPVPPLPTIRGMIYSAWCRPSLLNQGQGGQRTMEKETVESEAEFRNEFAESTSIGIRIVDEPTSKRDLRTRQKVAEDKDHPHKHYKQNPTIEETLIAPTYRIYVTGTDEHCIAVADALRNPERPLYLGRSDDLVDVRDVTETQLYRHESDQYLADSMVPNGDGGEPIMLPVSSEQIEPHSVRPGEVQYVTHGGTVSSYCTLAEDAPIDGPFVLID